MSNSPEWVHGPEALCIALGLGATRLKERTCLVCMKKFMAGENRICPKCKESDSRRFNAMVDRQDMFWATTKNLPSSAPWSFLESAVRKRSRKESLYTYLTRCPNGVTIKGLVNGTNMSDGNVRLFLKALMREGRVSRIELRRGRIVHLYFANARPRIRREY